MAYSGGIYTNPNWVNDTTPAINAENLNDISNALEDLTNATGGATSSADLLANIGALPQTKVASKGNSGVPVYFDASGTAQPIDPDALNATLGVDSKVTALQTQVNNIFGGQAVVAGNVALSYTSTSMLSATVNTGLSNILHAFLTVRYAPSTPMNQLSDLVARQNYPSAGQLTILAYGTFVSGHVLSVDWMAHGTAATRSTSNSTSNSTGNTTGQSSTMSVSSVSPEEMERINSALIAEHEANLEALAKIESSSKG